MGSSYDIAELIVKKSKIEIAVNGLQSHVEGGKINIENAKFAYPTKMEVKILDGVTINVKTNKIVAFVGHSGCGKSSIISLIERFYDPHEGSLLYNDINLKAIDNKWYH